MTNEPTTEKLLARITARDEEALGQLYDRFAPGLRATISQILSSGEEREEALESVFVTLWKCAGPKHGFQASPEVWLTLTARRQAVRLLRLQKKLPVLQDERPSAPHMARSRPSEARELALLNAREGLIRKSLAQLPAPQRKILNLALFEGYTEEEIAQILNEPLGRVRDEVRAAFSFVRQRLHTLMGTWTAGI